MTSAPASAAALDWLAARMGIIDSYYGFDRVEQVTAPDTKRAFLAGMGFDTDDGAIVAAADDLRRRDAARLVPEEIHAVAGRDSSIAVAAACDWRLEFDGLGEDDGNREGRTEDRIALGQLPMGLHRLEVTSAHGTETSLVAVAPVDVPSVGEVTGADRVWGFASSLYGLRSNRNLGLGDYVDLGDAAAALAAHGADFVGINPVHAIGTGPDVAISPYSPTHRGYYHTGHIAPDRVAWDSTADAARRLLGEAGEAAARLREAPLVDYPAVAGLRDRLLTALYEAFTAAGPSLAEASGFERFLVEGGPALGQFATYEALSDIHGPSWMTWPMALQDAGSAAVAEAGSALGPAIRFHGFLQWLASSQLAAASNMARDAGMRLGLFLDLAVGARIDGAEVWANRGAFASGVSQGAPPDAFTHDGQNWGLAPFSPPGLRRAGYRPFIDNLRATMRYAGLVRIDHVLGFARAFWLPNDGGPGAFVRYPLETLLAITAIEARRSGCIVVGEDLGLVAGDLRDALARAGLYGCAVIQLTRDDDDDRMMIAPSDYRARSLASFGNHDLPTLAGFRSGHDLDWQERLGHVEDDETEAVRADRAADNARLDALTADAGEVSDTDAVHATLARSPAELVAVQLDDAFGEVDQQNIPGTIDEHPNWRRRIAVPVESLRDDPRLATVGAIMRAARRPPEPGDGQ